MNQRQSEISRFFMAGINYRKTDAAIRSLFAISDEKYHRILEKAATFGVDECFIISTCNRTEIYGIAAHADQLLSLLCSETEGEKSQFSDIAYIKAGHQAVNHLLKVAAGLDSQILGDYEIVGQIKHAVKMSRERGRIGAFADRLTNIAFQCSKNVKNHTQLSGGTVSVSFAAIQYLRENVQEIASRKIMLVGTGKFGRNTCKNLVDYLGTRNITLVNRTEQKAAQLAAELGLSSASLKDLEALTGQADIILVATSAPEPLILKKHLEGKGNKVIIDLSIPSNVEPGAASLPGVTLINVDDLSRLKDETLAKREAEVPKAKAMIARHAAEFEEWLDMRRHVPLLKAVKSKLREIHHSPLYISYVARPGDMVDPDDRIQRVINGMASKIRKQNRQGCFYIEAINEFMETGTN
jgi:glutamyl-tRNA reductase